MASAIQRVSYYMAAPVETCERCSAAIKHVFTVQYRDGLREKYGSECINKILSGDTSLKGLFNRNVKKLQRYQRGLAALSLPAEQMRRGSEYYGSGLYFIADESGADVMGNGCWFFHPLYDAEKNAIGPNYIVQDASAHAAKAMREIEQRGKAYFAKEIARIEGFLARVIQKGLLQPQKA
jgi:hypothetical protein